MAQTALDAPRHTFARCFQYSGSEKPQCHFWLRQHTIWFHGSMAPFRSWQLESHMFCNKMAQTALDAPRHTFSRCAQHSVTVNSQSHFWLNQDTIRHLGCMAWFRSGQVKSQIIWNQMARTALDAPNNTFARCIQHSVSESSQCHFWLHQQAIRHLGCIITSDLDKSSHK